MIRLPKSLPTPQTVAAEMPVMILVAVALVVCRLAGWHVPGLYVRSEEALVLALLLTGALGVHAERRLGRLPTAVTVVVAEGVALLGGSLLAQLTSRIGKALGWRGPDPHFFTLEQFGPTPWMLAVLLAATASASVLWRRRLRIGVMVAVITAMLFLGHRSNVGDALGAATGLLVGVARARRTTGAPVRSAGVTLRERRTLLAIVVGATALGSVLARFVPGADGLLSPIGDLLGHQVFSPGEVAEICSADSASRRCLDATTRLRHGGAGPLVIGLMPMVLGLLFATGLRRGRRAAWCGTLVVFGVWLAAAIVQLIMFNITSTGYFGNPLWLGTATIPLLAALCGLWFRRGLFALRIERASARGVAVAALGTVLAGWVVYVAGGLLAAGGFAARPSFGALLVDYPRRLVPPRFLGTMQIHAAVEDHVDVFATAPLPVSAAATVLYEWIGIVVWLVLLALFWKMLHVRLAGEEDPGVVVTKQLLHDPGGADLGWMATWPKNQHWTNADRTEAVAYQDINGVYLSVGDPVAAAGSRGIAARDFADFALSRGAVPVLYSVGTETRNACIGAGWSSVQVAEETVIPLPELEFRGKKFQDVRTAVNRARKEEITSLWTTWQSAPLGLRDQIAAISEGWVADKGLPEMGFTLGGLDELDDPEVRLLLAVDAHHTVHGVTSWMPVYRDGRLVGLTLDFMRRRAGGFRPVMEYLIATAAMDAKDEGLEFLSLSGAPLAHSKDDADARDAGDTAVLDAILDRLGQAMEPVYGFRSLLAFKAKFQPEFRPMYMCYEDPASLGTIATAVARAYVGSMSPRTSARLLTALRKAHREERH